MIDEPFVPDDLIGLAEAARLLCMCPASVRRFVLKGELAGYRIGVHIKVSRADVIAFCRPIRPDKGPAPMTKKEATAKAKRVDEILRAAGVRK